MDSPDLAFRTSQEELEHYFNQSDSQSVEQLLNSITDSGLCNLKTLCVKWVRNYKGGDQVHCVERLLNKLKGTKYEGEIDEDGITILMIAASKGHKDLVEVILQ